MANLVQILIETSAKGGEQIARAVSGVSGLASTITGSIVSANLLEDALRTLAGGVKDLTVGFVEQTEQLGLLSERLNLSIPQYQAIQRALVETGSSGQGSEMAILRFNQALESGDPILKALGVTAKDTYGAFMQSIDILSRLDDKQLANAVSAQLFGLRARELIGRQSQLAGLLPILIDHYTDLAVSQEAARASATRLDTAWDRVGRVAKDMGDKIGGAFAQFIDAAASGGMFGGLVKQFYTDSLSEAAQAAGIASQTITADFAKIREELKKLFEQSDKTKKKLVTDWNTRDLFNGIDPTFGPQLPEFPAPPDTFQPPEQGPDTLEQFVEKWKEAHATITGIVQSLATNISQSFSTALEGLLSGTTSFAESMRSLFRGLVNSIISMLAEIARNAILGFILRIAGNLIFPGLGEAGAAAGGILMTRAAPARTVVNNYVQTLGVRDVIRQMTDPAGAMAMAARRRSASPA